MKIINKIILISLLAVLAYSCIEDDGNYDYTPVNSVTIDNVYSNWAVPLGEEYIINPEIDYGDFEEDDFNYYWIANIQDKWGDTISTEKNLHYKFLRTEWYRTGLIVEHKETGALTTKQIDIYVVPRYQTGWVILSEEAGESVLSYARKEESTIDGVTYPYRAFPDIYTQQNGTEDKLGTDPVSLGRHFTSSEDQILVVQGGGTGTVEISGKDFTKVITTQEEFVGSNYPAGFVPLKAEYGDRLEAILGTNGKLYTRINPNGSFQVSRYSNIPIPGVDIKKMYYTANLGFIHLYDELNHRIIGIQDEPQAFTGRILYTRMDPEGNNASEFTPLDNLGDDSKLEYCGSYLIGSDRYYLQILKKGSEFYFQTFQLSQSNEILYVQNGTQSLFVANNMVNDDSKYCVIRDLYFYFSVGNKLYYWDRAQNQVTEYYEFASGANIEAIEPNGEKNELGIGLDNGEFYIMDISYEALVGSESKVLLPMNSLGKVVDVQYKYGNLGNFNNQQQ